MNLHPRLRRRHCPHSDCPSTQPGARPRIVLHSRLRTRRGVRRRLLCKVCSRTFVSSFGSVYYRMRRSRANFDRVMRLSVEGLPQASIARASGVCTSTLTR